MSTYTRADKYTETDKHRDRYSDFLVDFTPHPNTKDLVRNTNEDSVRRSIRNLVMTDKYERLMQPKIGSNIRKMLFEPMNEVTEHALTRQIEETIGNYEPRAKLINVDIQSDYNNQLYRVFIYFFVINKPEPVSMTVNLYRVR